MKITRKTQMRLMHGSEFDVNQGSIGGRNYHRPVGNMNCLANDLASRKVNFPGSDWIKCTCRRRSTHPATQRFIPKNFDSRSDNDLTESGPVGKRKSMNVIYTIPEFAHPIVMISLSER